VLISAPSTIPGCRRNRRLPGGGVKQQTVTSIAAWFEGTSKLSQQSTFRQVGFGFSAFVVANVPVSWLPA